MNSIYIQMPWGESPAIGTMPWAEFNKAPEEEKIHILHREKYVLLETTCKKCKREWIEAIHPEVAERNINAERDEIPFCQQCKDHDTAYKVILEPATKTKKAKYLNREKK